MKAGMCFTSIPLIGPLLETSGAEVDLENFTFKTHGVDISRFIFGKGNEPLRHGANSSDLFQPTLFLREPEQCFRYVIAKDVNAVERRALVAAINKSARN